MLITYQFEVYLEVKKVAGVQHVLFSKMANQWLHSITD